VLGSINTPEKYEAKRLELAQRVWDDMEKSDSRECRNCHSFEFMDFSKQGEDAAETHPEAIVGDMTCIECHRGVAHKLPEGA
jgi:nitrate/TMAO reductase-like tetraheme cytochrome c subunit